MEFRNIVGRNKNSTKNISLNFIGSDINQNALEEAFINSLVNIPSLELILGDSIKLKPLKATPSHIVSELPLGSRMPFQRLKNGDVLENMNYKDGSVKIAKILESLSSKEKFYYLLRP